MSFADLAKTSTIRMGTINCGSACVTFTSGGKVIAVVNVDLNTRTTSTQLYVDCGYDTLTNKCVDYLRVRALDACFPTAGYNSQKALDAINQDENPQLFGLINDI